MLYAVTGMFRLLTNRLRLARKFRICILYQVMFLLVFCGITLQYAQWVKATWATNYCYVLKQCVFPPVCLLGQQITAMF